MPTSTTNNFTGTNFAPPAPNPGGAGRDLSSLTPPELGAGGRFAFTLVEILVVIGITAVLFFLLLGPLVNSFRLTQRAQMLVAAQDAGRRTLENLTRELGSAAYVFDNTSHPFAQLVAVDAEYTQDQFSNFLDIDIPVDPQHQTGARRHARPCLQRQAGLRPAPPQRQRRAG